MGKASPDHLPKTQVVLTPWPLSSQSFGSFLDMFGSPQMTYPSLGLLPKLDWALLRGLGSVHSLKPHL